MLRRILITCPPLVVKRCRNPAIDSVLLRFKGLLPLLHDIATTPQRTRSKPIASPAIRVQAALSVQGRCRSSRKGEFYLSSECLHISLGYQGGNSIHDRGCREICGAGGMPYMHKMFDVTQSQHSRIAEPSPQPPAFCRGLGKVVLISDPCCILSPTYRHTSILLFTMHPTYDLHEGFPPVADLHAISRSESSMSWTDSWITMHHSHSVASAATELAALRAHPMEASEYGPCAAYTLKVFLRVSHTLQLLPDENSPCGRYRCSFWLLGRCVTELSPMMFVSIFNWFRSGAFALCDLATFQ